MSIGELLAKMDGSPRDADMAVLIAAKDLGLPKTIAAFALVVYAQGRFDERPSVASLWTLGRLSWAFARFEVEEKLGALGPHASMAMATA